MHPHMGHDQQREDLKQSAFTEGARVGRLGLSLNVNPHRPDDPLYEDWLMGWLSAQSFFSHQARLNARRAA